MRKQAVMPFMQVQDAAELIRLEYAEMPGLQLTFWQAQRLWNLSNELCDRALNTLISQGFLVRTRDGRYKRRNSEQPTVGPIVTPVHAMGSNR
jgi:hypothetical protein